jgi:hypothetical protein
MDVWPVPDEALLAGFATGDPDAAAGFVRRSPKVAYALEAQLFAIDTVRGLETPAPATLRSWVEEATCEARPRRRHAAR